MVCLTMIKKSRDCGRKEFWCARARQTLPPLHQTDVGAGGSSPVAVDVREELTPGA